MDRPVKGERKDKLTKLRIDMPELDETLTGWPLSTKLFETWRLKRAMVCDFQRMLHRNKIFKEKNAQQKSVGIIYYRMFLFFFFLLTIIVKLLSYIFITDFFFTLFLID